MAGFAPNVYQLIAKSAQARGINLAKSVGSRVNFQPHDYMSPGGRLNVGDALKSADGHYVLIMQGDGNLAINKDGRGIWGAGTNGKGGAYATMQGDGNFVVYNAQNRPLWATNTNGHPGAYIIMQNDGNLVVYKTLGMRDPIWASKGMGGGGLFGGALNWVANTIKACGRAVGQAIHEVAKGAAAIGKALAKIPIVGPLFHGIWVGLTGPLTFADAIAQGKGLDGALMDFIKEQMKAIHEIAPYAQMIISCIPGIGPIASAVIGTAIALAEGQSIGDALMAGVLAAIPGGAVAKMAFDVGKAALQGKPIEQVALAAVEGIADAVGIPIPDAVKTVLSTGLDMTRKLASGVHLDKALLDEAGKVLPAVMGAAAGPLLNAAGGALGSAFQSASQSGFVQSIEHSGVVQTVAGAASSVANAVQAQAKIADAMLQHAQAMVPSLPTSAKKAFNDALGIGMTMTHAQNLQAGMKKNVTGSGDLLNDLAQKGQALATGAITGAVHGALVNAARNVLPPAQQRGFHVGIGLASHQVQPFTLLTIRDHLQGDDKKGFDMAMNLHVGSVAMKPPPASTNITAQVGYLSMLGTMGAPKTVTTNVAAVVSTNEAAKSGAIVAVQKVSTLRDEGWWEVVLRFFGMHPDPTPVAT